MDKPPSFSRLLFPTLMVLGSWASAQGAPSSRPDAVSLVILVVFFALSAFFSASETAIITLWPWKVRELAEREGERSPFWLINKDITRFLTTILVGNNLVNVAATALVTEMTTRAFGSVGVGYATGIVTVLVLFFGEITPKTIAVHNADRLARLVARPIYLLSIVLYPIGQLFSWAATSILRLVRLEFTTEPLVSNGELRLILAGAERSGAIEEAEEDMIEGVLELESTPVREVMMPRVDVVAIEASTSLSELVKIEQEHRFSRMPVYEDNIDHIVGVVHTKDLLAYLNDPVKLSTLKVSSLLHPAYFVPESMPLWNLLLEMRRRKTHVAIVVDEFGGTAGIATLEDIFEEIVGEIYDETDKEEEAQIIPESGGSFLISGQTPLDEVSEALGTELPEGEYETLSGFLYNVLGYIPGVGERIDHGGYSFIIVDGDERHIERIRATLADNAQAVGKEDE